MTVAWRFFPLKILRRDADFLGDVGDEVDDAVGVAPLVVVPAEDLGEGLAVLERQRHRERRVERARCRRADDVRGDDRVLGVDEDLGEWPGSWISRR